MKTIVPRPYNIILGLLLIGIAILAVILSEGLLTPFVLPISVVGYQVAGGKM